MAGVSKHRQLELDLQRTIRDLEAELATCKVKLAKLDPDGTLAGIPPIQERCTQLLIQQLLAVSVQGLGEDEIKAELGIREEDWEQWKVKHPEFAAAAARARTLGRAFWMKKIRDSIDRGDNRFPVNSWNQLVNQMFAASGGKLGDASKLLMLDLREDQPTVPKTVRRSRGRPTTTGLPAS